MTSLTRKTPSGATCVLWRYTMPRPLHALRIAFCMDSRLAYRFPNLGFFLSSSGCRIAFQAAM